MSITGIGIDLLHVKRLEALILRRGTQRFIKRILSPTERQDAANFTGHELTRYLGVRWTAKEAAYKALNEHYNITSWHQLELYKSPKSSLPKLKYNVHTVAGLKLHLSITHDGEYITAIVVAEG